MNRRRRRVLIASILLLSLAATGVRAEDAVDAESERDQRWQEFYRAEAAAYEFTTAGAQPETLELRPEPVMQWVSLNDFNGDVFIWTRDGRPEVVGTIFSVPAGAEGRRNVVHEFHSLSGEPLEAEGPAAARCRWRGPPS